VCGKTATIRPKGKASVMSRGGAPETAFVSPMRCLDVHRLSLTRDAVPKRVAQKAR